MPCPCSCFKDSLLWNDSIDKLESIFFNKISLLYPIVWIVDLFSCCIYSAIVPNIIVLMKWLRITYIELIVCGNLKMCLPHILAPLQQISKTIHACQTYGSVPDGRKLSNMLKIMIIIKTHKIHNDFDVPLVRFAEKLIQILVGAEKFVNNFEIFNVIAKVGLWTFQHRWQPSGRHTKLLQVIQLFQNAPNITDTVTVRVFKWPRINLVEICILPPVSSICWRCKNHEQPRELHGTYFNGLVDRNWKGDDSDKSIYSKVANRYHLSKLIKIKELSPSYQLLQIWALENTLESHFHYDNLRKITGKTKQWWMSRIMSPSRRTSKRGCMQI